MSVIHPFSCSLSPVMGWYHCSPPKENEESGPWPDWFCKPGQDSQIQVLPSATSSNSNPQGIRGSLRIK